MMCLNTKSLSKAKRNINMKFGILGDAKIAREKIQSAIVTAGHEIVQIGRRLPSKGADPIWGDVSVVSYEALLENPEIDVIYNPLPNHLHADWTIKALEAGKPVLCEKPIALLEQDLDRLEEASRRTGLYIYDGFMIRYHPQWHWLQNLDLGQRQIIQVHFTYPPQPEGNVRNFSKFGGGPLWDIGGYCLMAGLMLFGGTPKLLGHTIVMEKALDVEMIASGIISFGSSQILNFSVSSSASLSQSLRLIGTKGWASLDVPFNPPEVARAYFALQDGGKAELLSKGREIVFDSCDQYQLMVTDFVDAISEGRATDLSQSRHIIRVFNLMK